MLPLVLVLGLGGLDLAEGGTKGRSLKSKCSLVLYLGSVIVVWVT